MKQLYLLTPLDGSRNVSLVCFQPFVEQRAPARAQQIQLMLHEASWSFIWTSLERTMLAKVEFWSWLIWGKVSPTGEVWSRGHYFSTILLSCLPNNEMIFLQREKRRDIRCQDYELECKSLMQSFSFFSKQGQTMETSLRHRVRPSSYHVSPVVGADECGCAWFGQVRPSPVHCGAWLQLMMCSMVWGSPHIHESDVASFHLFMDALHRPSPTRRRFRAFQTAQGWSWPVARHPLGVMPPLGRSNVPRQ